MSSFSNTPLDLVDLSQEPTACSSSSINLHRHQPVASARTRPIPAVIDLSGNQHNNNIHSLNRPAVVNLAAHDTAMAATRKRKRTIPKNNPTTGKTDPNTRGLRKTSDDVIVISSQRQAQAQASVLSDVERQVLEVFYDIDLGYLRTLLQSNNNQVENVISALLDAPNYPRNPNPVELSGRGMTTPNSHAWTLKAAPKPTKYDYLSTTSFTPSPLYREQAKELLVQDFCILRAKAIDIVLEKSSYHYAIAHDKILTALKAKTTKSSSDIDQYYRLQDSIDCRRPPKPQSDPWSNFKKLVGAEDSFLKTVRRAGTKVHVTDPTLLEEVAFVRNRFNEWKAMVETQIKRNQNQEEYQKAGHAIECRCCFDSFFVGDMVQCTTGGHLFCTDCLRRQVDTKVFADGNLGMDPRNKQPALELFCFSGEDCYAGFSRPLLEKALPPATLKKYDAMVMDLALERAGIKDAVYVCPKCDFGAEVDSSVTVFSCPIAHCRFESCRLCRERAHGTLKCDEVEKDRETKARMRVEEAASEVKIRKCPKVCWSENYSMFRVAFW